MAANRFMRALAILGLTIAWSANVAADLAVVLSTLHTGVCK